MGFWNDGFSSYSGSSSRRHGSSSSYYKRRPRDGYINRMIARIRRMLRDLYGYARRHPVKIFFLVIMPLLTGGALHKILGQFGIRLPPGMFGGMQSGRGGEFREFERFSASGRGSDGGLGSILGGGGGGGMGSLIGLAKMFM